MIVPVQTEYFALEGLAGLLDTLGLIQRELNPRLTVAGMLLTMHDGRTRLAQDVEREVREHFPELVFDTVIPRNVRIGEAPSYGRPVIHHDPHCAGAGRLLRAGQGGGRPWLTQRGMGRGLRRSSSRLRPAEAATAAELRELPVELIAPNPQPAAPALRRGGAAGAGRLAAASAACCSRSSCARVAGGTLRAGRRRAPLARRAAGGLERDPGARARRATTRESLELALIENMAREDLNPVEEARACAALVEELGLTREEVGRRVGRSRVAVSNLMRLLDLPDEALELLEDGRADRGPRPRAAAGRRPRRRAAASRARAAERAAGRCASIEAARARRPTRRPAPAAPAAARRVHPDQEAAAARDRRRARRGARPRGARCARAATATAVELAFDDASTRRWRAGRAACGPRAAGLTAPR